MNYKDFGKDFNITLSNGNNLSVKRCVVNKDTIENFKEKNKNVKFIFFDNKYSDISYDNTVNEIHRFKSRYPGNSYVRLPLSLRKSDSDKYVTKITLCADKDADGYVMISKLDLIKIDKSLKSKNKQARTFLGTKMCIEKLTEYNNLLLGNIYTCVESDNKGNVIRNENIIGTGNFLVNRIKETFNIT